MKTLPRIVLLVIMTLPGKGGTSLPAMCELPFLMRGTPRGRKNIKELWETCGGTLVGESV